MARSQHGRRDRPIMLQLRPRHRAQRKRRLHQRHVSLHTGTDQPGLVACRKLDEHARRRNVRSNELRQQPRGLGLSITIRKPVSSRLLYFCVFPEQSRRGAICQFHNHDHRKERLQWNSDSDRHGPIRIEMRRYHSQSSDSLGNGDRIMQLSNRINLHPSNNWSKCLARPFNNSHLQLQTARLHDHSDIPAGVYTTKSATATISVLGESGFNGTVALAETIPPGLDCGALAANNLTGSGSTTVSCSSPTAGTYALNVTGTSGPLIHSAFAVFRFKDFILTTSPPPPVDVGTSANSTITIFGLNGFSGTVLFADTVPNGLTCGAITPNNITANGNATLSCNSKAQSVYSVTIQATSGSLSHSTSVSFAF